MTISFVFIDSSFKKNLFNKKNYSYKLRVLPQNGGQVKLTYFIYFP